MLLVSTIEPNKKISPCYYAKIFAIKKPASKRDGFITNF